VVAADREGDGFVFRSLIRSGGHSTVRVLVQLLVDGLALLQPVRTLGCTVSPSRTPGLFVVDVPPEVDYDPVVRVLAERTALGWWAYEEGALATAHADAASLFAASSAPHDPVAPTPAALHATLPAGSGPTLAATATALRGVNAKQRDFLARSRADHLLVQPRLVELERRLLRQGGGGLVFRLETDLDLILNRGQQFSGRKLHVPGRPSECHKNVARLWRSAPNRTQIVAGWALCADGLWRQHSWLVRRHAIVETTAKRKRYFGAALSESEAQEFAAREG
jgi:hypothetical protein